MKQKELYASPETEVMELRLEGVIAASKTLSMDPTLDPPFGSEDIWSILP